MWVKSKFMRCKRYVNVFTQTFFPKRIECQQNYYLRNETCRDGKQRKHCHYHQREFPPVHEGVDDVRQECHEEEYEHADFLSDAFLQLVQVTKKELR